ncbi:MAG: DUF4340 domain-containing protein [Treponema sp.]|jgi:hypothetical protein|nr:DUF4340 domain-containing protein [Treponema sp.]
MVYKKKLTVLSGIIAALALIYMVTVIFDPERRGARSAAYSWLEPAGAARISGITIANGEETVSLARNGGKWFVSHDGKDYPAKDLRVEDFIAALAKRAPYPLRSSSASSHERLSLTEEQSTRITVAAGAGLPLLSLLMGQSDLTGQNVYLRKQGENEVRSGEDIFSVYTQSAPAAWYNLRLFPESENGKLDVVHVQRLTVYPPPFTDNGEEVPLRIFTRKGREWTFNFELARPDMAKVDNYIRDILNTSGDDFVSSVAPSDSLFNNSRIVLELGNGSINTVRLGPPDEDGKCFAAVSGSDWGVYSISAWASRRLFPDTESFEVDGAD